MSDNPTPGWLARHADVLYKLVLVVLLGFWVAFPPQTSQPRAAPDAMRAAETRQ